jgi:hypothetical protein
VNEKLANKNSQKFQQLLFAKKINLYEVESRQQQILLETHLGRNKVQKIHNLRANYRGNLLQELK